MATCRSAYQKEDYAAAVRACVAPAKSGNSEAQYYLGVMYDRGLGVPPDYHARAAQLYRLAAEQGHAGAQLNLGVMYREGRGVGEDYLEAVRWLMRAAEQGYAAAQFELAATLDKRRDERWGKTSEAEDPCAIVIPKEPSVARNLRGEEADAVPDTPPVRRPTPLMLQGMRNADRAKARLLRGSEQENAKQVAQIVRFYRLAAERGHAEAQYHLASRYYAGYGVPKDIGQSARWFRRAAEQGHERAQYKLGGMYSKGEGVPQDTEQAAKWYRHAAEQGCEAAQEVL